MRNKLSLALLVAILAFANSAPSLAYEKPSTAYAGEIKLFAGPEAPKGYEFCDGRLLPLPLSSVKYWNLFSVIQWTFGGDKKATFALPDLREMEKSMGGVRFIIATEEVYFPY
ncbi:tail fiber protein [Thiomicrorhabdus sp.]|uniref:phage tail protein n=1 Tax=Thiomicrorhabdus sp. TaxID=2039724 RepID=UPI0029C7A0A7|nr:tail fiber protein [Thiomicrorhabdus sp.]